MEIFGYTFTNESLAEEALTTPSCKIERPTIKDNQRLEFLGDAVLGMLSAERVFTEFPDEKEGSLTVRRTHSVSTAALCAAANRFDLASRLKRNRGAAPLPSGSKTLADAVEAIIGAAYLDGGFDAARRIFDALELPAHAGDGEWSGNPKGELQVLTQAMTPPQRPVYELISTQGKAHAPIFTVKVSVPGLGEATASASSMKAAESAAARGLLREVEGLPREG